MAPPGGGQEKQHDQRYAPIKVEDDQVGLCACVLSRGVTTCCSRAVLIGSLLRHMQLCICDWSSSPIASYPLGFPGAGCRLPLLTSWQPRVCERCAKQLPTTVCERSVGSSASAGTIALLKSCQRRVCERNEAMIGDIAFRWGQKEGVSTIRARVARCRRTL